MSDVVADVITILGDVLQLGDRTADFDASTPLLGSLPELDSMAVVTIVTTLEEQYGFFVEDDEISTETFETVGALAEFVSKKLAS